MEFMANLIKAEETEFILVNCTHVKGRWWIFEGDLEFFEGDYEFYGEGVVGSLGGLTEDQLIATCLGVFNITQDQLLN